MKNIYTLLFLILFIPAFQLIAQTNLEKFTIDLEIRPRFELRDGFKKPISTDEYAAAFIEQRSRLYFNYQSEQITTQLTLQDVRIWGNVGQVYKNDPSLNNVYEAWASFKINDKHQIKVGRQALNYDNARFLGNLDWAQQGRSHDAFIYKLNLKESKIKLDFGFTWNNDIAFEPGYLTDGNYGINNNKTMQFIWFNKQFENNELSLLVLNNGAVSAIDQATYFMPTVGLIGNGKQNEFQYHGEVYYQTGKDTFQNDVSAYLINAEITLKPSKTGFTLGADWLSGTEKGAGSNNSFNPLYGTNHKFYGAMDYFYGGNTHKQAGAGYDAGLIDIYEKVSHPISDKIMLHADLHQFLSPTKVYDATDTEMSMFLGTELDLTLVVKPTQNVSFFFGYSHMIQSKTLDRLKGTTNSAGIQNWAWIMLQIKPSILLKN